MHWRKTAKVCQGCNEIRAASRFIPELENCVYCEAENSLFGEYKTCVYCKRLFKPESSKIKGCGVCIKRLSDKYIQTKGWAKLPRNQNHLCTQCNISKRCSAFNKQKSIDYENLICTACTTKNKIDKEGKFRCKSCCSVFLKEECHWNKYCPKCYEKNKTWNKLKHREYRKDPYWQNYFKEWSRYYYWNVEKPLYNKTFALQWKYGLLKPRKVNRSGYWFVLNRGLFNDFKRRPKYWFALTEKAIKAMRRSDASIRLERLVDNPMRNNAEWHKRMNEPWD